MERTFMQIYRGKYAHKYANAKGKICEKIRVKLTKSVANLIGK